MYALNDQTLISLSTAGPVGACTAIHASLPNLGWLLTSPTPMLNFQRAFCLVLPPQNRPCICRHVRLTEWSWELLDFTSCAPRGHGVIMLGLADIGTLNPKVRRNPEAQSCELEACPKECDFGICTPKLVAFRRSGRFSSKLHGTTRRFWAVFGQSLWKLVFRTSEGAEGMPGNSDELGEELDASRSRQVRL